MGVDDNSCSGAHSSLPAFFLFDGTTGELTSMFSLCPSSDTSSRSLWCDVSESDLAGDDEDAALGKPPGTGEDVPGGFSAA